MRVILWKVLTVALCSVAIPSPQISPEEAEQLVLADQHRQEQEHPDWYSPCMIDDYCSAPHPEASAYKAPTVDYNF